MHVGYLLVSIGALILAVACFLAPGVLLQLSQLLDRSVGALEVSVLKRRAVRYVLGLLLFAVSFTMFRFAYLQPLYFR